MRQVPLHGICFSLLLYRLLFGSGAEFRTEISPERMEDNH